MQDVVPPLLLLREEIPDDESFLDEMLALVERTEALRTAGSDETIPAPQQTKRLSSLAGRAVSSVMFYGALALVLLAALVFNNGEGEIKNFFGFSYFTVMTPSMESSMPVGSLIITKQTKTDQLAAGDVITFYSYDGQTTITHRIMEIIHDGELKFLTKGDDNVSPDAEPVAAGRVIGKVVLHAKALGKLLLLLQKHVGLVLLFFFLLVGLSFALQQFLRKDSGNHPGSNAAPKQGSKRKRSPGGTMKRSYALV